MEARDSITELRSLGEVWSGLRVLPEQLPPPDGIPAPAEWVFGTALVAMVLFALVYRQSLAQLFRLLASSLFFPSDLVRTDAVPRLVLLRAVLVFFSLFLVFPAAVILDFLPFDETVRTWWDSLLWSSGALGGYFLLRRVALSVTGAVSGFPVLLRTAGSALYPFYLLSVAWLLVTALICVLTPQGGCEWTVPAALAGSGLCLLVYLLRIVRLFVEARVPFLFTFLYLCTFEITMPALAAGACIKHFVNL